MKKGVLLKIVGTVSLQMQLPNVTQLMLIVHTYIKNEATFLFTKFLPYLWVSITRNLIHKYAWTFTHFNICTTYF